LFFLSSCAKNPFESSENIYVQKPLDRTLYNQVQFFQKDEGFKYHIYGNSTYYQDNYSFFTVTNDIRTPDPEDILLGYTGFSTGWFWRNDYFSNTNKTPLFIYEIRMYEVYFLDEYDYKKDTFLIEGTTCEILFSDAIKEAPHEYINGGNVKITLQSQSNSRIRSDLFVVENNGKWYVTTRGLYSFEISDSFKNQLIETGII
jgi:hypothetical protein